MDLLFGSIERPVRSLTIVEGQCIRSERVQVSNVERSSFLELVFEFRGFLAAVSLVAIPIIFAPSVLESKIRAGSDSGEDSEDTLLAA